MIPDYDRPDFDYAGMLVQFEREERERAERIVEEGKPCPHSYKFKEGTTVELGFDCGWFCKFCGKERAL